MASVHDLSFWETRERVLRLRIQDQLDPDADPEGGPPPDRVEAWLHVRGLVQQLRKQLAPA